MLSKIVRREPITSVKVSGAFLLGNTHLRLTFWGVTYIFPMFNIGAIIVTALVAFAATNIDDFAVLLSFFASVRTGETTMRDRDIFVGQYLGMFVIIILSLAGWVSSFFLPG